MFPSRYVLALAGLSASPVEAAPSDGSMDGGFDGDIQEISVTAVKSEDRALRPAQVLDKAHISRINPIALSDIFRTVMGVGIRTNSRGDAVLRLRGSEERQSQIFVDGAPISVPWDGRADLSLFPASLIKNISIIKGAAPIEYGANAALGVIDISTLESGDEVGLGGRVETGSHSAMMIEGETYIPLENNVGLQLGFNYHNRDAISVANRQTIPFDPLTGEGRTNTDLESASVFAAASMERDWGSFRLSTTDISAEKGIAAAAHIDPAVGNPRFWRYPDWDLTQLSLAGEIDINDRTNLRFNAWQQWFAQTIVSYTNATYSTARSRQEDEDKTFGSRAVLSSNWTGFTTRIVASTQQSTHHQIENNLETNTAGQIETFRQRLSSIGGEIDIPAGDTVKTSLAVAYDRASTPLTGNRPQQSALSRWATSAAAEWQLSSASVLTGTLSKRTRFPTMRELYGTALGSFLLNPDLKPENALVGDLTFKWSPQDTPIELTSALWFSKIDDTLSRRTLLINGNSYRQRYNIGGSFGYGLEVSALWQLKENLSFDASAFLQNLKADKDAGGNRPTLYQRPDSQFLFATNYEFENKISLRGEINHTGKAYDQNEDGSKARLGASTEFNVKFFVPIKETDQGSWQFYGSVDNLTDTTVLPQLGLPAPGRTIKIGLRFSGQ